MGCDIHIMLERRIYDRWVTVSDFAAIHKRTMDSGLNDKDSARYLWWRVSNRNYELFTALAGVRGEKGEGPEPRGFPADAADWTRFCFEGWGEDAHSASWMALPEALPLFIRHNNINMADVVADRLTNGKDKVLLEQAEHLFNVEVEKVAHLEEFRIVFWFDN